ncbi:hypothetical protein [Geothermobacter hydrogeniphilus]|uniref:hypothetical protein n=1 Tax=Geothermobacter hydrogeniphilus TaxID=1969733 RepID=UPI001557BAC5|nr:hypothetical protein [Geothermobacter hydrogeniphilus]
MTAKQPVNIISILWGKAYSEEDVNILFAMIRRNSSRPVNFHLFSNEALPELNPAIIRHPEPAMRISPHQNRYAYRKEAGLCADDLGGLTGQRVFFFDLDVLIMDDLDELFAYPEGDKFYIINDWNSKGDRVGQATCYSFVVGTLGSIRETFEADPDPIIEQYGTASQEYLSAMVIQKYGRLNFWPEAWFRSFRFHCLPFAFMRHFQTPSLPQKGTKVLAFHGHPDIHDALAGRWSPPDIRKAARGWKRIYKACRPTPWIRDYWYES